MCSFSVLLSVKVLLTKWNPTIFFLSQFPINWKVLNLFLLSFFLSLFCLATDDNWFSNRQIYLKINKEKYRFSYTNTRKLDF